MFKLVLPLWLWSALAVLLTGCIREELEACPTALVLRFRLAGRPGAAVQTGIPQADRLAVFVFNERGYFLSRQEATGVRLDAAYRLPLSLGEGNYRIVVWAGYTDDYFQLTDCLAGKTRLDDFRLQLKRNADRTVDGPLPLLYHGRTGQVQVEEAGRQTLTIDLWQLTNRLHVAAELDGAAGYSLQIEDDNGLYDASAGFLPDDRLTYLPVPSLATAASSSLASPSSPSLATAAAPSLASPSSPSLATAACPSCPSSSSVMDRTALTADFRVMKLAVGRKPLLKILDEGKTIRYAFDLIGQILGAHPAIDFAYDHDFRIEIRVDGEESVRIKVNGWEVISEEH